MLTNSKTDVRVPQSMIDNHIVPDNELSDSDDGDGRKDHMMEEDKGSDW